MAKEGGVSSAILSQQDTDEEEPRRQGWRRGWILPDESFIYSIDMRKNIARSRWRPAHAGFAFALGCLIVLLPMHVLAQEPLPSGDEVVQRFLSASGQDRWSSIKTLIRKGEVTGNLSLVWAFYHAPKSPNEHATWESFYKAPNLHLWFVRTLQNTAADMQGCDGATAWVFSPRTGLGEHKMKPGEDSPCKSELGLVPEGLVQAKSHFLLKGKKLIGGKEAYVVDMGNVDLAPPGAYYSRHVTFYFGLESSLLLRMSTVFTPRSGGPTLRHEVSYADYRDIGGMRLPFRTEYAVEGTVTLFEVKEIKIDSPIDGSIFQKPKAP
jgi:hypothetical protein